jgi:hypothetical protein
MNIHIPRIKTSFSLLIKSIIITATLCTGSATTWLGVSYYQKNLFSKHISTITALWQKHISTPTLQKTPAMNSLHDSLRWIKQEFIKHPARKQLNTQKESWGKLIFEPSYKLLCRILDEEKTIPIPQDFLEKIARQVDGIWEEFGDEKDASFDADTFFLASIWRESMYEKLTGHGNTIHTTDATYQASPFTFTPQKVTPFTMNKQKQNIKNTQINQPVKNTKNSQSPSNEQTRTPRHSYQQEEPTPEQQQEQYWQNPTQNPYYNTNRNNPNNTESSNDDMSWLSELMPDEQMPQRESRRNKKPAEPTVINQIKDDTPNTIINTIDDSSESDSDLKGEEMSQEKASKNKELKEQLKQQIHDEAKKDTAELDQKYTEAVKDLLELSNDYIESKKRRN